MSDRKPDRWAIAFCAPERETDALVTLLRHGEKAAEIRPTRFLGHSGDVIVMKPPVFELPPFEFRTEPRPVSAFDRLLSAVPPRPFPLLVTGL